MASRRNFIGRIFLQKAVFRVLSHTVCIQIQMSVNGIAKLLKISDDHHKMS